MPAARRAVIAVLAVVLATALVPALASGAGKNTTIAVSLKFPAFHGTLGSPRSACLGSRKVKMYREKGG